MTLSTRLACIAIGVVLSAACQSPAPPVSPAPSMSPPPNVSLIVANGIVVTMDGQRRVLNPGSVVIDGTRV
ncbi:MAG: hypothetical protein ACRD2N_15540, partial [Vicinamibacterales bacterium]